CKAAHRFCIAVRGNSDEYLAGPNIDSGGIGMQDCQVLDSFLSLYRHFVLPDIPGRMPMVRSEANSQSRSSPYANVITKLYATKDPRLPAGFGYRAPMSTRAVAAIRPVPLSSQARVPSDPVRQRRLYAYQDLGRGFVNTRALHRSNAKADLRPQAL